MTDSKRFDVIIIGGSYAGLSAAMSLGRALRNVLIIDSGSPCNQQTPQTHNYLTHDGEKPSVVIEQAKTKVLKYGTVIFHDGLAVDVEKTKSLSEGKGEGLIVTTESGEKFQSRKLIFATGLKDLMPDIPGFKACWGISVIHCPYCHGYEVKNEKTGIMANGIVAFNNAQMIRQWTKDLTILTNGPSSINKEHTDRLIKHNIPIIETELATLNHENGNLYQLVFKDHSTFDLKVMYAYTSFEQHCKIPERMGCQLTEEGLLKVDSSQKTTVSDVFACGDNASPMRAIASAVASGNHTGGVINKELIEEEF